MMPRPGMSQQFPVRRPGGPQTMGPAPMGYGTRAFRPQGGDRGGGGGGSGPPMRMASGPPLRMLAPPLAGGYQMPAPALEGGYQATIAPDLRPPMAPRPMPPQEMQGGMPERPYGRPILRPMPQQGGQGMGQGQQGMSSRPAYGPPPGPLGNRMRY